MSVPATQALLQEILQAARKRHGGSCRSFAEAINRYYGAELTAKDSVNRLETRGVVSSSDARLLALIAPLTPYSSQELLEIAKGDFSTQNSLERASSKRVQSHPSTKVMPSSAISYLLRSTLRNQEIPRSDFASKAVLSLERLNEIIDKGVEPSEEEFQSLANAINHYTHEEWTGAMLGRLYRDLPTQNGD